MTAMGTSESFMYHPVNDHSWPKALVPRNTMNVSYREIAWLKGESF